MSSTSTTPPPSYTSQDKGADKDNHGSVAEREESGVDRSSGHSPSRRSQRSSRSAGDDNDDKKSTKSPEERRRSRHSSRHRHSHHDEDKDKAPSEVGHTTQPVHSGEGPHDDQKSINTVGTRRSHRSSRHHDHHSHHDGEKTSVRHSTHSSPGGDDKNGDHLSTRSLDRRRSHRSSRSHHRDEDRSPSEVASVHDVTEDDLQHIARTHMRRSQCGPEFLKELAEKGVPEDLEKEGQQKFRVVTGAEARSIYNEMIKEDEERRLHHHHHDRDTTPPGYSRDHRNHNVVFAFPVHVPTPGPLRAGGRKVVDYYMTWKGKTGTHRLKGRSRKTDFLEPEFMKIAHGLDEQHKKRLSRISTSQLPPDESRPPITTSHSAPPAPLSMLESQLEAKEDPLTPPKPPFLSSSLRDSNPSVLSLPNLGFSLPLRVTNPDPASSSGTESIRASIVVTSPDAKKSPKKHDDTSKVSGKHTSTLAPVAEADEKPHRRHRHKHHRSKRREVNSSSESISASSISTSSSSERKKREDEILIVLMDSDGENDRKGKHDGLRRSHSAKLPARRTSTRSSPWNAPAATSNGNVHRYVPGVFDVVNDEEEESSEDEDEEDDGIPSVPMKTALQALGLHSPNNSMPNLSQPSFPQPSPHISLHSQAPLPTPASHHQSLPPVSHFHRSATLPTPVSMHHQPLPPASSPYHLTVATELYKSPYSFSTPNLPNTNVLPSSAPPGIAASNSSYVVPWVVSTPVHPPPGSLPPAEHPAASPSVYNSPYVPPAQAPYPYTPVQVYASPAGTMNRASPYVGMSGAGGGNMPLPAISIYSGTPIMAPEAQLY